MGPVNRDAHQGSALTGLAYVARVERGADP
jgi:hypothetical protein